MAEIDTGISCPSNNQLGTESSEEYSPPTVPTRIILRLLVTEFDEIKYSWNGYRSAIETYLIWAKRPLAEYKEKKHNIHVEPFQDEELNQKRFHGVIDLNALSFDVKDMKTVHHEMYDIKRDGDGLKVLRAKRPDVGQNLLLKTRHYTDRIYPWNLEGFDQALVK